MYKYFENDINKCVGFPRSFLWGAACAGHQVEGNNTNSDIWVLENTSPSVFSDRSGDACNSFELWDRDIGIAEELDFNCYRFSIEWARIEPSKGYFSTAMTLHYKNMIDACLKKGIKPVITLCHFSCPVWFAAQGGWTNPEAPVLFSNYCKYIAEKLFENIDYVVTINEPNILRVLNTLGMPDSIWNLQDQMLRETEKKFNVNKFSSINATRREDLEQIQELLISGHKLARKVMQQIKPTLQVGFSLAVLDEHAVSSNSVCKIKQQYNYGAWLTAATDADFIGVQNYERIEWNDTGVKPPPPCALQNKMKQWIEPSSLANSVQYIYDQTKKPIFVTEHGVATDDDELRQEYIPAAIEQLLNKIKLGVPVLGYIHWTLIDNFEWVHGFNSQFGLCSVDLNTFERTIKPSAYIYRSIINENKPII